MTDTAMTGIIKQALEHIELNLKTIVTADELARAAGYSVFHFHRMFSRSVGTSVAAYITRRRLDRALMEISGGRAAAAAVLEYGFDTYAGFYKAFVKVYGCSPKKYLAIYGKHTNAPISRRVAATEIDALYSGGIMYTEQQLREILANWNVPRGADIGEVCIMDGTRISDRVWQISGGLILKTGDRAQLLKNLKIAKALAAQGLPSALPVATAAGAEYLDGREIFTLTRAISGSELAKPERWGRDRADYGYKYGRSIAKLHRALAEIEAEIEPDEADLLKTVADRALPETKRHNKLWNMGLPDSFFGEYIREFAELLGDLPKQLIHRDPNPSNILFDGGEVSGFIDFDLSERNIRLWDVCYCATGILSEWRGVEDIHGKWLDILGGILRGYGSVNAFTDAERRAVWHVICAIGLSCVSYFGANDEFRELAATNREMLSWIVANRSAIEKSVAPPLAANV